MRVADSLSAGDCDCSCGSRASDLSDISALTLAGMGTYQSKSLVSRFVCCCCLCCEQVRRRMEDENRKARRTQRREYLDNVRELVTFIKKRDKRVAKFQV